MTTDVDRGSFAAALSDKGLLPSDCVCLFLGGSLARGWAHPNSDVDLYAVTSTSYAAPDASAIGVPLRPGTFSIVSTSVSGVRWDVEYWLTEQVEQILDKVSWEAFEAGRWTEPLAETELDLLDRLRFALPVLGEQWLRRTKEQIEASALGSCLAAFRLGRADHLVEDALGHLEVDQRHEAVLAVHLAFGHAVDALLASLGEYDANPRWRARRFGLVEQKVLSFDDFWSATTMQGLDPRHPAEWVRGVVRRIADITSNVEL